MAHGNGTGATDLDSIPPLALYQRLPTSGARAVLPVHLDGQLHLIVPQLARDIAATEPHMNGGDSDIDALVFRWEAGRFVEHERFALPGGEDALVFTIADMEFLATASVRTGSGPYDLNACCTIYRREQGKWQPFQSIPSFAAKQWHHLVIGERHFLALAQGVTIPSITAHAPRFSRIFEWCDGHFELFQVIQDGGWGYNWASVTIDEQTYLAYADHTSPSRLLRWNGARFEDHQNFAERGGRAFAFFEQEGQHWLAFAAIDGASVLYRWDGTHFVEHQHLGGPGGREFAIIRRANALFLVRICFIEGDPTKPKTDLTSQIFLWTGDGFMTMLTFPTFGGTDAATFEADGALFLAVSNSLTADVRFRQDSAIYRFDI